MRENYINRGCALTGMEPWLRVGSSSWSSLKLIMLYSLQVSNFSCLLCSVFPISAEYTQLQYVPLSALLVFSFFIMWPDLPTVSSFHGSSFHGSQAVLNTNWCTWQVECGAISSALMLLLPRPCTLTAPSTACVCTSEWVCLWLRP